MVEGTPDTRTALLDAAEPLVLDRGFDGATVEAIVERAGLSKGAFFHHFSSKAELGRALAEREAERELARLQRLLERAGEVSEDPLIQVLITVALLEEELSLEPAVASDGGGHGGGGVPGSVRFVLAARGPEGREAIRRASGPLERRREILTKRLEAAAQRHAAAGEVDPVALAEMLDVILDGARLARRTSPDGRDAGTMARQLAGYRGYLELLFSVSVPGPASDS